MKEQQGPWTGPTFFIGLKKNQDVSFPGDSCLDVSVQQTKLPLVLVLNVHHKFVANLYI